MSVLKVLAIVMAGGEGQRLEPLTGERSKPAVPFGGRYRIVDFVLSNLINSGIHSIYLLVQYKSQSLIEHVRRAWAAGHQTHSHFVTVVPPQMRGGPEWFQGTADAVYQNLGLLLRHHPDLVAVFGAGHIYRMDVNRMVQCHLRHKADVIVAALSVPIEEGHKFGVMCIDSEERVSEFREKSDHPAPLPNDPGRCYASMGNYVFSADVLIAALNEAHARGEKDFGQHVLPRLTATHRVYAFNFGATSVPGTKPYEERGYWRDVGTIDAYHAAHQDLLGVEPRFDLFNPKWPIYSDNYSGPATKIIGGQIEESIISGASLVNKATVRNSVIRREVLLEPDVEIEDCIIMDYSIIGTGSRLRRTIVDRYNIIQPNSIIGFDPEADRRNYSVSPGGIVVVPKGQRGLEPVY